MGYICAQISYNYIEFVFSKQQIYMKLFICEGYLKETLLWGASLG